MFSDLPSEKLKTIADSVMQLSDFYIQNPEGETPWKEKFCQIAYRYYYLPLNYQRCEKVIQRGLEVNFFDGLTQFIDWGAGPGTASLALAENAEIRPQINKQILSDLSLTTLNKFSDLHTNLINKTYTEKIDLKSTSINKKTSCLVFSYSLTEKNTLPNGWNDFEALMILEPSTRDDGRRLLELRNELIQQGYSIWAPCTHQKSCPLLIHSKHDWCHDRLNVNAPNWFSQLENLLPMKNKTITVSYLLARKKPAPEFLKQKARLTGDSLEEKGKTRQLICRSEEREFLTWMHKNIKPQVFPRGELISLPTEYELKSNELRLKNSLSN